MKMESDKKMHRKPTEKQQKLKTEKSTKSFSDKEKNSVNGTEGTVKNLWLNSFDNTQKSLARLIREFHRTKTDPLRFKAMLYGFNIMLSYWKMDKELEIEKRIIKLEKYIFDDGNNEKKFEVMKC